MLSLQQAIKAMARYGGIRFLLMFLRNFAVSKQLNKMGTTATIYLNTVQWLKHNISLSECNKIIKRDPCNVKGKQKETTIS